jgi:hypothetical protein
VRENDNFKKIRGYSSHRIGREKQQEVDKELRTQLRKFKDEGEAGAKIQRGKVVKKLAKRASGGALPATTVTNDVQSRVHGRIVNIANNETAN